VSPFSRHIQRLEGRLNLRLGREDWQLYAHRDDCLSGRLSGDNCLIAYNLRRVLPIERVPHSGISFCLSPEYFLGEEAPVLVETDPDELQGDYEKNISAFLAEQTGSCSIISAEDLELNLTKHKLSHPLLPEIVKKSHNRYLTSIMIT
jgi:hypothetical protein